MTQKIYDPPHQFARMDEHDICPTLIARAGTGGGNVPLVLMDQGGDVMTFEIDKVGTLRANTHGHEPIVLAENTIGRKPENGGNGTGYSTGCSTR